MKAASLLKGSLTCENIFFFQFENTSPFLFFFFLSDNVSVKLPNSQLITFYNEASVNVVLNS